MTNLEIRALNEIFGTYVGDILISNYGDFKQSESEAFTRLLSRYPEIAKASPAEQAQIKNIAYANWVETDAYVD